MTTGERIRKLRIKNGLAQSDLAIRAGCSSQVISNIERGYSGLSADLAARISDLFAITVDELMRGQPATADILTLEEKALIERYRRLSPHDQNIVSRLCEIMTEAK